MLQDGSITVSFDSPGGLPSFCNRFFRPPGSETSSRSWRRPSLPGRRHPGQEPGRLPGGGAYRGPPGSGPGAIPPLLQAFYHPYFCLIFRIFGITIIKKTTLEKVSINFNSTILVRRKRVCIGLSNSRIFHQNNAGGLCR